MSDNRKIAAEVVRDALEARTVKSIFTPSVNVNDIMALLTQAKTSANGLKNDFNAIMDKVTKNNFGDASTNNNIKRFKDSVNTIIDNLMSELGGGE
ncbi:MAG: hypothetical protein Q4G04_04070 [bacterium]|nr:hypothetical protein [bacterium]